MSIEEFLFSDFSICKLCLGALKPVSKKFSFEGFEVHVLYASSEFLDEKLKLYLTMHDRALAFLFLEGNPKVMQKLKKKRIVVLPVDNAEYLKTGYHPMEEVFAVHDIPVWNPFFLDGGSIRCKEAYDFPMHASCVAIWSLEELEMVKCIQKYHIIKEILCIHASEKDMKMMQKKKYNLFFPV